MSLAALPLTLKVLLVMTVAIGGLYDLRYRRIPNWLCFAALPLGIGWNTYLFGWHGLWTSLLGIACALLIYLPLYLLRGMGAGDVKLMMAIGAVVGPYSWFQIFAVTAVIGGILGLCLAIARGRLIDTLWNVRLLLAEFLHLRLPHRTVPALTVSNSEALRLPHGVSIALGSLAVLQFHLLS